MLYIHRDSPGARYGPRKVRTIYPEEVKSIRAAGYNIVTGSSRSPRPFIEVSHAWLNTDTTSYAVGRVRVLAAEAEGRYRVLIAEIARLRAEAQGILEAEYGGAQELDTDTLPPEVKRLQPTLVTREQAKARLRERKADPAVMKRAAQDHRMLSGLSRELGRL